MASSIRPTCQDQKRILDITYKAERYQLDQEMTPARPRLSDRHPNVKRELWTFYSIRAKAVQNRHARKTGNDDISAAIHRLNSRNSLRRVKHEFWSQSPPNQNPVNRMMRTKMGDEGGGLKREQGITPIGPSRYIEHEFWNLCQS
jgi:hypothetical protein